LCSVECAAPLAHHACSLPALHERSEGAAGLAHKKLRAVIEGKARRNLCAVARGAASSG